MPRIEITICVVLFLCLALPSFVYAEALEETVSLEESVPSMEEPSSKDLVGQAWAASSQRDLEQLNKIVDRCLDLYGSEARLQKKMLSGFPERTEIENYQSLNDVATCLFVRAEATMNSGKTEKAIKEFQVIIDDYKWGQAWDPRGWYWSVAEKSQDSINVIIFFVITVGIHPGIKGPVHATVSVCVLLHPIGQGSFIGTLTYLRRSICNAFNYKRLAANKHLPMVILVIY